MYKVQWAYFYFFLLFQLLFKIPVFIFLIECASFFSVHQKFIQFFKAVFQCLKINLNHLWYRFVLIAVISMHPTLNLNFFAKIGFVISQFLIIFNRKKSFYQISWIYFLAFPRIATQSIYFNQKHTTFHHDFHFPLYELFFITLANFIIYFHINFQSISNLG